MFHYLQNIRWMPSPRFLSGSPVNSMEGHVMTDRKQYTRVATVDVDVAASSRSASPVNDDDDDDVTTIRESWWSYIYDSSRSHEETRFIKKLDFFLVLMRCLGSFIKNLDQEHVSKHVCFQKKKKKKRRGRKHPKLTCCLIVYL